MPWYRVPFNLYERARREAEASKPASGAQELARELALAYDPAEIPALAGTMMRMHFGSRGNRNAPRPCSVCGWISERLCDWIMTPGPLQDVTCDRPLCAWCTSSPAPGKDLCPQHELAYRAWCAGRTNSTDGVGP